MSFLAAAATLLGGLLSKPKTVSSGESAYSHVEGIMQAAEDFKINPLTLLGSVGNSGYQQLDGGKYLGAAIADAGLQLADAVAKRSDPMVKANLERANLENQLLKNQLSAATLRPKVPGIYGASRAPSDAGQKASGDKNVVLAGTGSPFVVGDSGRADGPVRDVINAGVLGPWAVGSPYDPVEKVESEYGELVSLPFGVGKLAADAAFNLGLRLGASSLRDSIHHAYAKKKGQPYTPEEKTRSRLYGLNWSDVARTSQARRSRDPLKAASR